MTLHHEEFQSFCRYLAGDMDFCCQCHQIDMPERMKKNSGIQINFVKIASFVFAKNKVQWKSNICKHTKYYQPFSSLSAALAVDPLCYILVYLMTTSDMGNIIHILCISGNVRKIMYIFQNQVCQYCACHISIMIWLHNHRYRIGLLSM